ncbi:AMIN-like domain-containing (lipo)protein [Nesterenkonia sphaerica]|uniref:AMIN-like domain-containing protein n=1 Tax=Nesterenkonia sphaerica TaxID=1804988 RepID=A0A5R9ALZ1_9MICC|nr:hypothetical protein [Nesterenkonia sphaerica]TLP79005.1 hypothetical protein FEF27_03905 [Nesterenkonia sphaerica]
MKDVPLRTARSAAMAAALTACLAVAGCTANGEDLPQQEQQSEGTEEPPPLDEPTHEPLTTASKDQASTVEDEPEALPEASSESDEHEGEPAPAPDNEVLDVTEFSADPLQSEGFPDLLTEVPEGSQLLLEQVRVGVHEGYHRIVFDHAGAGAPGWSAEYVDEAVEPGSGFPLEMTSEAILYVGVVGLEPANASQEEGQLQVSEPIDPAGTVFSEIVTTFVHHGSASYYIGLDTVREYRISVWEHPEGPRLIIDVLV